MKTNDYTNDPNRFINKRDAADLRGVSTRTIEREVHAGRLKKYKVRGCVRFRYGDVMLLGLTPDSNLIPSPA